MPSWLAWSILLLASGTLVLLVPLALHRASLIVLARRGRPESRRGPGAAPLVTVQLPLYNEPRVVARLIDAAARLDHPLDRLEIQVLDDSTDETSRIALSRIEHWRRQGLRIEHLRRPDRTGFKAGALAHGLERAVGDFILVLDADFVPGPSLIRELLGPFADPGVGMVQAHWDHLNAERSALTRAQALLLDAHFFLEQGGRAAGGRFMNFNGTAGMWRREALEAAGGWSADTLTEDLDISYRAQMAGWRFAFLPEVGVPAELPEEVRSLEVQQMRWAQGGVETGRKILPTLLRGRWRPIVKVEAVLHLFGHLAHPVTLLLGVLLLPSALARRSLGLGALLPLDLVAFLGATGAVFAFHAAAARHRGSGWASVGPRAILAMILAIGLTATVSRAALRGLGGGGERVFHRTPKRGGGDGRYVAPHEPRDLILKLVLTFWMVLCLVVAVREGLFFSIPFVALFGLGWGWLAVGEIVGRIAPPGRAPQSVPEVGAPGAVVSS